MILHDGINPVARFQTVLAGGTPPNRAQNDDDIEPLLKLNEQEAIWVWRVTAEELHLIDGEERGETSRH